MLSDEKKREAQQIGSLISAFVAIVIVRFVYKGIKKSIFTK